MVHYCLSLLSLEENEWDLNRSGFISWINEALVSLRQAYHFSLYFPMFYGLLVDTLIVWDFISMNLGIGNLLSSER